MQDAEPLTQLDGDKIATHTGEPQGHLCPYSVKVGFRLLGAVFGNGHGEIAFLDDASTSANLVFQHGVEFLPEHVVLVTGHGVSQSIQKVLIQVPVDNGDLRNLRGGTALVNGAQVPDQAFLLGLVRNRIVNIGKLEAF